MHKLLIRDILCIGVAAALATHASAHDSMARRVTLSAQIKNETAAPAATRDTAMLEQSWLQLHNNERLRMGFKPLVWDANLASDAAKQAVVMAKTRVFEHADQGNGEGVQGENMWMGTKNAYDAADMVGIWIAEGSKFKQGTFPNVSKTGDWTDIGHYTQLIWPDTKSVGCALAGNRRDEYMVCRYLPAGNVLGQKIGVK